MRRILTVATIVWIFSSGTAYGFAAATPDANPGFNAYSEASRPSPRRRHTRRAGMTIPYLKNSRPIRVRRLSRRQVRYFYRRMFDIHLN